MTVRTAIHVAAAIALPLAACSNEPQVTAENASVEEVAGKVRNAGGSDLFVRPGKWESKITVEEMSMPGMPAEMAAQMKSFAGRVETRQSCLSEEQAKRPKEDFFAGKDKSCRYDHFKMGGGEIDATMNCSVGGVEQVMTMKGNYSPESYRMRMEMSSGAGPGPAGGMTMKMRVDARRIGECEAQKA